MSTPPAKLAVMVSVPSGSADVSIVAVPWLFSLTVPRMVLPAVNVTFPVGVIVVEVTLAVKMIVCPFREGFGEEVMVVLVGAGSTVWGRGAARCCPDDYYYRHS